MAPEPLGTRAGDNYYEVLGVAADATGEDIRKTYHSVVRTLHPDRRRPGVKSGEDLERFHQVQNAWRCLSDPTRKLLYDLRVFGCSLSGSSEYESRLLEMHRQQAARDVANMEVVLDRVLQREKAKGGILIKYAIYGNLRLREDKLQEGFAGLRTIQAEDLIGPVHDVTVPVQCLVEQHTIVLRGGASASMADLPGFFNPAPLDPEVELGLYVLYEFKGILHEVNVGDRETLSMPYRRHAVPPGQIPRGPFSSSNVMLFRQVPEPPLSSSSPAVTAKFADASERPDRGGARRSDTGTAQALQRAVSAYRFQGLCARSAGDATPHEFTVVALAAGLALALTSWLATRRSRDCR